MGGFDTAVFLQKLAIWAIPVLFAITVHEAAHGYAAFKRGDSTAWMLGRVTLNPLKHIDPFGTILLPMLMLALTGFVFGYAKPVPVHFNRLRNIKWDTVFVALAGPMANLFLVGVSIGIMWLALLIPESLQVALLKMAGASVVINFVLMWLNLMPVLPLDGGRALHALLPPRYAIGYAQLEQYGMIILLLLLLSGVLFQVLMPLLNLSIFMANFFAPVNVFVLVNTL